MPAAPDLPNLTAPEAPGRARPAASSRRRIDGLDGLRALAVIGVLLYHAEVPWARGGFIGVDVFFVLSGYLVTGIVLSAVERTGGLGFGRFWSGRARRLAPAQLTLFAVLAVVVMIGYRNDLADLRKQVLAALTGTTNWYLIEADSSYFEQLGRPPLLRHLWSLAIELQFYLVFPVLLVAMLRWWHHRLDRIVIVLLVAVAASSLYLAFLFHPGADPSRAYFDTFGRLAAPLLGAALAIVWRPDALRRGSASSLGAPVGAIGAAALVALLWAMHVADDRGALMYRGGFLLVALLSVLVVAAAVHPGSWLGSRAFLASPLLVAIGLRSFGLYLWHWPVFMLLRPGIDVSWSWGTTFWVRIALTVFLTECCYRLVERPWHLRSPDASLTGIRRRLFQPSGVPTAARLTALAGVLLLVAAIAVLAPPRKANDEIADSLTAGQSVLDAAAGRSPAGSTAGGTGTAVVPPGRGEGTTTTVGPDGSPPPTLLPDDGRVTLVGDSVMLGAAPALIDVFGDAATIDAKVARQAAELAPVVRQLGIEGRLASTLVLQVGINGTVTEEDLRAVSEAAPGRRLLVINSRVPRSWQDSNNEVVRTVVPTLPHASVIDWYARSDQHRDWYLDDGVHLDDAGRAEYAEAIKEAVQPAPADGKGG